MTFFYYPTEHWKHLRTTNAIESRFAIVRLRERAARGAGSRTKGILDGLQTALHETSGAGGARTAITCRWSLPAKNSWMESVLAGYQPSLFEQKSTPGGRLIMTSRSATFDNDSRGEEVAAPQFLRHLATQGRLAKRSSRLRQRQRHNTCCSFSTDLPRVTAKKTAVSTSVRPNGEKLQWPTSSNANRSSARFKFLGSSGRGQT